MSLGRLLLPSHVGSISLSRVTRAEMNGFWSPTTTTWPTIGFARIGSSSAAGATFLPPAVTMISFLRPVIVRKPSESNAPMSPVLNQSPSNVAAVASGLRQYSLNTLTPRTWISPSSAMRTPTPGSAGPTVPIFDFVARFTVAGAVVSVRP